MSKFYSKYLSAVRKVTKTGPKQADVVSQNSAVVGGATVSGPSRRVQIFNKSDNFAGGDAATLQTYEKNDQVRMFLCEALSGHYLFESLSDDDLGHIIECMKPYMVKTGEYIIKQGDFGDLFYCMDTGHADASVDGAGVVVSYERGGCFGELALIYNSPRAASVLAKTDCSLWTLDLRTFRSILANTSTAKMVSRCEFLKKCPFLDPLSEVQIGQLASALDHSVHEDGDILIKQGEKGDSFYIIESGSVKCTQTKASGREVELLSLKAGDYFGEMALMLNETRHANCVAIGKVTALSLSRDKFRLLLGSVLEVLAKRMRIRILQSVPLLAKLGEDKLGRLAGVMRVQSFKPGAFVIRQGEEGSRFYIINEGDVRCTRTNSAGVEEELITLSAQEFFGERALITNEPRKANVTAIGHVECLVLERANFQALLGEVQGAITDAVKGRGDEPPADAEQEPTPGPRTDFAFEDLKIMRTIGTGTFGRVKLVKHSKTGTVAALKAMNKSDIVSSHQENNVMAEKNLLYACSNSPFVLALLQTFNLPNQIFMLMEFVQGGELWSYVYEKTNAVPRCTAGGFEMSAVKFYSANVILAFKHLHKKNIAYRDLKPENILIDQKGYLKIIDFGFAKVFPYMKNGQKMTKTFTLCGTPEYLAPEIVMSKGYDKSVDCWALGCLIYELYLTRTPFQADYTTKIFQNIVSSEKSLVFPARMDQTHVSLVKKLLNANPAFRLGNLSGGIDDIIADPFFSSIDWVSMENRTCKSPYVPKITAAEDASNFDQYEEEASIPKYSGNPAVFSEY